MNTSHLDQMSDNFKSNLCPLQLKGMEINHRFVADLQNMVFSAFCCFSFLFCWCWIWAIQNGLGFFRCTLLVDDVDDVDDVVRMWIRMMMLMMDDYG